MANKAQQFVVKSVKQARSGDRRFYNEVGRLFIRETEKGVSGTLYIHAPGGEFAVFPVELRVTRHREHADRRIVNSQIEAS